jgi:hypothetical protein
VNFGFGRARSCGAANLGVQRPAGENLTGVTMKSSTLIPLVFLMMAHSAQAAKLPVPDGPSDPPVSHFQGACESDPEGTKFAQKACYTVFDPAHAPFDHRYRPPVCRPKPAVTQSQREVLAKAYKRAPDYVKAKLCRLTQLFVTESSSAAPWGWGLWEGPDRVAGSKAVYVAIAVQELASKNSVADGENKTMSELLGVGKGARYRGSSLLRLKTTAAPDPELTVLAALAHELGHALLADANADGTDRRNPRRKVSGPPRSACFEDAFLGSSWDPETFHRHMKRWVEFGDQNFNKQKNPNVAFNLERLRAAVRKGRLDVANEAIRKVYASREFVSFAGAYRPEEEVAEVYKYKVLADAMPNQAISFGLNGQEINVFDLLQSEIPAKKVQCLRDLGFLTGQP